MFIKTIAVGPLELVASCVTGGTIVAYDFFCTEEAELAVSLRLEACRACFCSCFVGSRNAMGRVARSVEGSALKL